MTRVLPLYLENIDVLGVEHDSTGRRQQALMILGNGTRLDLVMHWVGHQVGELQESSIYVEAFLPVFKPMLDRIVQNTMSLFNSVFNVQEVDQLEIGIF